ncbi:MAG: tRNA (adenosine(37)-N6)-threonylcarbamoyltransferase complex transferase subunit TsaD [Thomasclavelia sp.]|jgi:N6-L-threonylcarbamoyladenine synthase|nr:tRNA (adenosine(37)-N6)-threonylcarbamoyltransferase complex transferase subunit TsaD [Thomasclavelia sp.]
MATILAIESSCDEMAMAILKDKHTFLSSVVSSQIDVHALYGGVVPEIASRKHVESVSYVLKETLNKANISMNDIDAIAVTKGPGLVGSLHIGLQAAKTLALTFNKPLIGVHHIAGHIYANNASKDMNYPSLALVVSGGHTELVLIDKPFSFKVIGETLDDAVGEAYDKVGRVLNLPYPGGPVIDKMAHLGKPTYDLPMPLNDNSFNFSFSGLKSAVINLAHNASQRNEEIRKEDLASSFQDVVIKTLVDKTLHATNKYNIKNIVVAGGVSANKGLREILSQEINKLDGVSLNLPPMDCCTDNAKMIALAARQMYELKMFDDLSLGVKPYLDLENESRKAYEK